MIPNEALESHFRPDQYLRVKVLNSEDEGTRCHSKLKIEIFKDDTRPEENSEFQELWISNSKQ